MFARRDVEHGEPIVGQITTPGCVIFGDVPSDIGKLKREAKVACPVKCRVIVGWNTHNHRHHDTNCACDMVAILIQIAFAARAPVGGIQCEAFNHVFGHARGNSAFVRNHAKAVKGGLTCRCTCQCHCG